MTLFSGDSLLVSLPGAEIGGMLLPGSLCRPADVLANAVSSALRSALEILVEAADRRGLPITCVGRPELFTHGISKAWFRDRVSPAAQHVCLSDGGTVKHLPGLPTHVFFYCLSFRDSATALHRLSRRAPELMADVQSQVNSHLVLGRGYHSVQPTPVYLSRAALLGHPPSMLLPFFLNRDSAEVTADWLAQAHPVNAERLVGFASVLYLPLTETALADRAFGRAIMGLLLQAFFDLSVLLVLCLPDAPGAKPSLAQGIGTLLDALRESGVVLPRACPINVLFAIGDLEEDHALLTRFPLDIVVHESFDFWRYTTGFYAGARHVTILAEPESVVANAFLPCEVSEIYGTRAVRRWLVEPAGHD